MGMHSKLKTGLHLLKDSNHRFVYFADKGWYSKVSDEEVIYRRFWAAFGRELDLENPVTYTEKLQWLKLYDHRPQYTTMVDKHEVKRYVAERIGEQYVIPTLNVWERVEDIDFDQLPDRFVLKCTHDSGSIVICKDKNNFDPAAAVKRLKHFMNRDYYVVSREWPYKNVKPRIIAEPFMEDKKDGELRDYKFFTFGGVPKVLYIAQGRGAGEETVADFFDMNFQHLPFTIDHEMAKNKPHPPVCFEEMQRLAGILSQDTPQLRVDFYEVDGKVYFGEMTFFHCSGLAGFHPEEWDRTFGDWVTLPEKRK